LSAYRKTGGAEETYRGQVILESAANVFVNTLRNALDSTTATKAAIEVSIRAW
jgi:hypothetical protein